MEQLEFIIEHHSPGYYYILLQSYIEGYHYFASMSYHTKYLKISVEQYMSICSDIGGFYNEGLFKYNTEEKAKKAMDALNAILILNKLVI